MRTWISNLHRSLNLSEPGRIYSELAASWLWVIALGGMLLWIDRIRRRTATRKPQPPSGRARILWLHGITGTILFAGFLFLSASGLSWSANAGANISNLRTAFGWATPTVSTDLGEAVPAPSGDHSEHTGASATAASGQLTGLAHPALFDVVERIARADIINAPMIDIKPPATSKTAWTVSEAGREWPANASAVAIDPATEKITDRVDFGDFSRAAKLTRWAIAGHNGVLFGLPNQLVLFAMAAGLTLMVHSGYVMWWKRRPVRGSVWAFGRPAPRGAFLRGHWAGVLAAITVMVAVGFFLPLLGWSLLASSSWTSGSGRPSDAATYQRRQLRQPTSPEALSSQQPSEAQEPPAAAAAGGS